jgi:methionine-rich copper-binding protein CopC
MYSVRPSPLCTGLAVLLLVFASAANGHSASDATTPADGATLSASPGEIRVRFDQPIRITLVRITDRSGNRYEVRHDRGAETDTLVGTPEPLPEGAYTVEWRGLSADGHPASGEFTFRIE